MTLLDTELFLSESHFPTYDQKQNDTSTETGFTPGWETPSVPVSQPGARIRD